MQFYLLSALEQPERLETNFSINIVELSFSIFYLSANMAVTKKNESFVFLCKAYVAPLMQSTSDNLDCAHSMQANGNWGNQCWDHRHIVYFSGRLLFKTAGGSYIMGLGNIRLLYCIWLYKKTAHPKADVCSLYSSK